MIKEILDMQDMKDDVPTRFANKGAPPSPANRINTPLGVDPKALAKAAAARIDQIEQEMALDLRGADASKLAVHPRANELANRGSGFVRVALPPGMAPPPVMVKPSSPAVAAAMAEALTVMPEMATNLFLGNTSLAQVIDVKESTTAPALEEATVLFANGQLNDAINVLVAGFSSEKGLGGSEFNAYRTLLDLLRIKGDQAMFDNVAMDFVVRFEKSPPSWEVHLVDDEPVVLGSVPSIDLGEMLDVSIVPMLEQLKVLAQQSTTLRMDASHITNVNVDDGFGCELMLRVMRAFEQADFSLEVVGIPQLVSVLRPHLKVGNKAVSPHVWMLYLELLRLVNQPGVFEERATEFVITYEVSPPSWIAPSSKIKMTHGVKNDEPTTVMQFDRLDHIRLKGDITGDGEALINEIAHGLQDNPVAVCDCSRLRRMEFSVAAKLLTALTFWTSEHKVVEFRNLNHPIASLFVALGIHHLAVVERRRDA
jgi:ABC-type transporter Mla MlaB component